MKKNTQNPNYVGITGCTTPEEARSTVDLLERHGFTMNSDHVGMVGLLISPRNKDSNWKSNRYPSLTSFPEIIDVLAGRVFLTLHIDEKSTSNWLQDLLSMMETFPNAKKIDGIQCNVMHPKLDDFQNLSMTTKKKIILQYSTDFLSKPVSDAMTDLKQYLPYLDYILIDPSRGRGLGVDLDLANQHYIEIVKNVVPHYKLMKSSIEWYTTKNIHVGFAGGFQPRMIFESVKRMIGLVGSDDFSIDVESGVRSNETLDLEKVDEYLKNVQEAFEMNKKAIQSFTDGMIGSRKG